MQLSVANQMTFASGSGVATNPITKKLDCKFWVHQWCIGLYYKMEEKLKHITYFCEEHGRKKTKVEITNVNIFLQI